MRNASVPILPYVSMANGTNKTPAAAAASSYWDSTVSTIEDSDAPSASKQTKGPGARLWRARPRRNRYMEVFFWVLKVRYYIPLQRRNYVGAQCPTWFPSSLEQNRGPWVQAICYAPTIRTRRRTLRTHTAAEVMLASSSSTRNGRTPGQPRPAPAVPVMGASDQPLEPAAHHR